MTKLVCLIRTPTWPARPSPELAAPGLVLYIPWPGGFLVIECGQPNMVLHKSSTPPGKAVRVHHRRHGVLGVELVRGGPF